MLPTADQIKQFLIGTIVPPIAGVAATWVVGTHVLALFAISHDQLAYEVTQILTFGVVTGISWLTSHHILTGSYKADTAPVKPL